MKNYYDDFKGEPSCDSVTLPAATTQSLPDQPCKFVQIHNWTTNAGTVGNNGVPVASGGAAPSGFTPALGAASTVPTSAPTGSEVYYGFRGKLCNQVFPGYSSNQIPCTNLSQISLRPGAAGAREVFYTWWK